MGFNVTCTPGREAAVAYMRITPELPALVIYLDPVNMAIQLPSCPDGSRVLAKFCRELSREAALLADDLESAGTDSAAELPDAPRSGEH